MKARLRPLALQATAAERAEKLRGEIAGLRARLAELDLAGIDERLAEVEERRTAASMERKRTGERLEALLAERNRVEEELAAAAGRGDGATSALYRLRSAVERLELRRDAARELGDRLRAEPLLPRTRANPEREALQEQARLARERLAALEHSLAEREGLPPAARALAEEGERLALSLLEVDAGYERAVAAALARRAAALVASDAGAALGLVERARKAGLGDLAVLVPPRGEQRPTRPPLVGAEPLSSHVRALPGGERVAELLADVWLAEPSRPRAGRDRRARHAGGPLLRRRARRALVLGRDGGGGPAAARRPPPRAWPPRPRSSSAAPRSCPPRRRPCRPARWSRWRSASRPCCRRLRPRPSTSRRRCGLGSTPVPPAPASWPRSCAGSAARRPRSGEWRPRRASAPAGSTSSARAWRPRRARRGGGSRRREPSLPRATTAKSSPSGSSGSSAAARRSARSTRWPRRSTSARRSG